MEESVLIHQTAQAFYAAFKKLPSAVREEFKAMIETPIGSKKKKYANDTEYLMRNEASKTALLKSIQNVKEKKNLTTYTPEEWETFVKQTIEKANQ
ncbi:hypothetical protein LV89_01383 [Arcicella aurantiaca]|uniref:Uncharacterized protein n=1 Tax=Arcicella aurantiaca TaxID=591202 RepID=A0A316EEE6_9BACT|nr:hypothetical protein [Arcicella aurantiaca]PWK27976.1 hypothetical protein LV89_01383 [Arcicella aurantiaca]